MRTKIYVPDIECDSCVKIIDKKFKSLQGIMSYDIKDTLIEVEYDESLISPENIITTIKGLNFRASFNPFERKSMKERYRHYKENRNQYLTEINVVKYIAYIFLILSGIELVAYFGFLNTVPDFLQKYGWWIFYLNFSIAFIFSAVWHFVSYKAKVTCMTGMMIGMTLGMQTGMMLGAVTGATNGFFIGSMVGMILGVLVGAITGNCCGIMGIMEGMMAGIMGGTMGSMISVMMFTDHILIFMPFYMLFNALILLGFSYMLFEEVIEGKISIEKRSIDFTTLASLSIIFTLLLIILMIYGPKGVLFA